MLLGHRLPRGSPHPCSRPSCSGIPETVPLCTINRQCSSGLQALATIAGESPMKVLVLGQQEGSERLPEQQQGEPRWTHTVSVAKDANVALLLQVVSEMGLMTSAWPVGKHPCLHGPSPHLYPGMAQPASL